LIIKRLEGAFVGKKRIIAMSSEEPKKEKKEKLVRTGKEAVFAKASSGQGHGRIADMGLAALEEPEKIKEKSASVEAPVEEKPTIAKARAGKRKPARKRGQRYLTAKKQVDPVKRYPLSEAIKLVKKTSIARFNGKIELHLVLKEKISKRTVNFPHPIGGPTSKEVGPQKLNLATEKKDPLIHLVIGKVDTKDSDLGENFQTIIGAIGPKNIRKAVLTSTMGPGVKVDPGSN